jgi:Spy/CpxP family protein refolding chaperone
MRSTFMHSLVVASAVALACTASAQAQETMSPLVKQMFNGGWPDKASIEQLNKDRLTTTPSRRTG